MDRKRALELAQKLANFNNDNATIAEVELAATRLAKIMTEHNLSELDLKAAEAEGRCGEDSMGMEWVRPPVYIHVLVCDIGKCFRVQPIFRGKSIIFVGEDTDVALAKYFCAAILGTQHDKMCCRDYRKEEAARGLRREGGRGMKGYVDTWYLGFVKAVMDKVRQEYEGWYSSLDAENQSKARGMIVVKDEAISKYMSVKHPKLRYTSAKLSVFDHKAYADGDAFGKSVRISKGLDAPESRQAIG